MTGFCKIILPRVPSLLRYTAVHFYRLVCLGDSELLAQGGKDGEEAGRVTVHKIKL